MRRNFIMSAKHGETSRNSSSEEWTIIDKTENLDEGENSEKLIPEARHLDHIETFSPQSEEPDEIAAEADNLIEESDGISVITDSDSDHVIVERRVKLCNVAENNTHSMFNLWPYVQFFSSVLQDRNTLNATLTCFLAILVGVYFGRSFPVESQCSLPSNLNSPLLGIENILINDYMEKLSEVNKTLNQVLQLLLNQPQFNDSAPKKEDTNYHHPFLNATFVPEEMAVLKNICSEKPESMRNICQVPNILLDLSQLKSVINRTISEPGNAKKPKKMRFFQQMEKKISYITESFLDDLLNSVDHLVLEMRHEVKKVKSKLDKWMSSHEGNILKNGKFFLGLGKDVSRWMSHAKINDIFNETKKRSNFWDNVVYSLNSTFNFWTKTSDKFNKLYKLNKNEGRARHEHWPKKFFAQSSFAKRDEQKNAQQHNMDNYVKKNHIKSPWNFRAKISPGANKKKVDNSEVKRKTQLNPPVQEASVDFAEAKENNSKEKSYSGKERKCWSKKGKKRSEDGVVLEAPKAKVKIAKSMVLLDQGHEKSMTLDRQNNDMSETDWQWKRYREREAMRRFENNQPNDWYWKRMKLRRHFRNDGLA